MGLGLGSGVARHVPRARVCAEARFPTLVKPCKGQGSCSTFHLPPPSAAATGRGRSLGGVERTDRLAAPSLMSSLGLGLPSLMSSFMSGAGPGGVGVRVGLRKGDVFGLGLGSRWGWVGCWVLSKVGLGSTRKAFGGWAGNPPPIGRRRGRMWKGTRFGEALGFEGARERGEGYGSSRFSSFKQMVGVRSGDKGCRP